MNAALLTVGSSMQNDPIVSKASELLRLGLMPSADAIKAGQVSQLLKLLLRDSHCYLQSLLDVDASSIAANVFLK